MLLFLFSISFLFSKNASALSCALPDDDKAINHYHFAVLGTVSSIQYDLLDNPLTGSPERAKHILFNVEKSWDKEVNSQIIFDSDVTWGHKFKEGETYLVYLNEENGKYSYPLCGLAKEFHSNSDIELEADVFEPAKEVNIGYKMWHMIGKEFASVLLSAFIFVVDSPLLVILPLVVSLSMFIGLIVLLVVLKNILKSNKNKND